MEGTLRTSTSSLPVPAPPPEPKPNPPRPQSSRRTLSNKRAKTSKEEAYPSIPTNPKIEQKLPFEYVITGMLVGRERYPEDIKTMRVTISQPSPDDECPIFLEAISTAQLSFLPGVSFFKDKPEYTKMTLPCGHSFSAMILIYNWCKNKMLCPCCRQGLDRKANPNYLPTHFREQIKAQLRAFFAAERIEDERESIQAILNMEPMTVAFSDLADQGCLEMTVGFYFRPARDDPTSNNPPDQQQTSSRGHFSMIVRLTAQMERRGDRAHVAIFRPSERNMTILRQTPSDVRAISISTQMRIPGAGIVEIDNSGEIDFPEPLPGPMPAMGASSLSHTPLIVRRATGFRRADPAARQGQQNRDTIPVVPVSTFEITFGQCGRFVYLDNAAWVPDSTHVGVSLERL